jgi:nickel transport protein
MLVGCARRLAPALAGILLVATPAAAHEVIADVSRQPATVVTLTYADGQPFSYEAFEVHADGAERPLLVGRTDGTGRAVFLVPPAGEVRLRAFSADGHGVDLKLAPPAAASGETGAAATVAAADERPARIMFGLGVLLALFGLLQMWLARRKRQ